MRALALGLSLLVMVGCSDSSSSGATDAAPGTHADGSPVDGAGAPGDTADAAPDAPPGTDADSHGGAPDPDSTVPDAGGGDADGEAADTGGGGGTDPTNACGGSCGTGVITGLVCAPNEQVFVNGATVSVDATGCDGQPVHIEVTSDAKGRYTLEGVPCGYQTVHVQKGSFEHSFKVPVPKGGTADVTAAGTKQCFKATGVRIAVVTGDWDEIGGLVDKLGFSYDSYELYGGWGSEDWSAGEAIDLLLDPAALASYDVLFINCGAAHDEIVSTSGAVTANLRQWVEGGGSLYVSDFAFVYAEQAWPWAVDFMGDDSKGSMYDSGGPIQMSGNQGVPGHVLDAALASYLGVWYIAVQYDLGPLAALSGDPQPAETTVHVDAYVEQFGQTLPLVVSFVPKPGAGRVVVTTFHNDAQATDQMLVTLSYLVFTL